MTEVKWWGKRECVFYIIFLALGIITICLNGNIIVRIIIGVTPLLVLGLIYLFKKPSIFIIIYFFLVPLSSPYFFPIEAVTPAELLGVFVVIWGLLSILTGWDRKTYEITYKNKYIFIALISISFFGLVSTIANLGNADLFENLSKYLFKPIFFSVLILVLISRFKDEKHLNYLIFAILFSSFLVGALCFYALLTLKPLWAIDQMALRVGGTFPIYNHLSGYEVLMIFFTLGLYFEARNKYFRAFLVLTITFSIIAQLTSHTLGGILGIIVGVFTLTIQREHRFRNLTISLVILIIVSIGALLFYPPIVEKFGTFSERITDRIIINYVGIKIIKSNFWFGVGSGAEDFIRSHQHLRYTPFGPAWNVPHNLFITTFVEARFFYLGALLALLYFGFRKVIKALPAINNSKNKNFYKSLLAGMVTFLVQCMSNNLFWHVRLGIYLFLFLALIIKLDEEGDFNLPKWL